MIEVRVLATVEECTQEARMLTKNIRWGKNVIFTTPERFQQLFSPERLKIIILLGKESVGSVSELAQRTDRLFEAVHRDLKILEVHGIVTLTRAGRNVVPALTGKITVPIVA